jgi:hypothetical protein
MGQSFKNETFNVWSVKQSAPNKPDFDESDNNKIRYGQELAKGRTAFEAATAIFGIGQGVSVWVSENWPTDHVVLAAKSAAIQSSVDEIKILDKDQLCAKVLTFVDEKYTSDGVTRYTNEGKDRLAALKLYADLQGFIPKEPAINLNNNINNNALEIVFVKPEQENNKKIIDIAPNSKSEILNNDKLPVDIKLVGVR